MIAIVRRGIPWCFVLGLEVCGWASRAWATTENDYGTVTRVEGEILLLTGPLTESEVNLDEEGGFSRYYSSVQHAQIGDKLDVETVVVTKNQSRVRIVYSNGDQLVLGPKSVFRATLRNSKTAIELLQGAVKAWISKAGPRAGMRFRTRTSMGGVRGTEFILQHQANGNATFLSVMRGRVGIALYEQGASLKQGVEIRGGQTAEIATGQNIAAMTTTADVLQDVENNFQLSASQDLDKMSAKQAKMVEMLEKTSARMVLHEIKTYEPKLFSRLSKLVHVGSLDEIIAATNALRVELAPKKAASVDPPPVEISDEEKSIKKKEVDLSRGIAASLGLFVGRGWGKVAAAGAFDWILWGRLGIRIEALKVAFGGEPKPPSGLNEKVNQVDSFIEVGAMWRAIVTERWMTLVSYGVGSGAYNEFITNEQGLFANKTGQRFGALISGWNVEQSLKVSSTMRLMAGLGVHRANLHGGGIDMASHLKAGILYLF